MTKISTENDYWVMVVLGKVGQPFGADNQIATAECLRKIANGKTIIFDEETQELILNASVNMVSSRGFLFGRFINFSKGHPNTEQ